MTKNRLKRTLLLALAQCFCLSYGQTYTLRGVIVDSKSKDPLEMATVFVKTAKDSILVGHSISNSKGTFEVSFSTKKASVAVNVSYTGYKSFKQIHTLTSKSKSIDLGTVLLEQDLYRLGEVSVVADYTPIKIKGDTTEYKAGAYKVRPDSNVKELLKQFDGVEVTADGTIKINGKTVDKILVNGRSFFGKDGKIAIENLPSEIIDKVQVSDTKTKEEELSKQTASGNEKTINLTIKKDKSKGVFGKATAGYGTDDRYDTSMIFNAFKDKRKVSVLASSNNINSLGFSMDEVFDNMGYGRNNPLFKVTPWGSVTSNAPQTGITQSTLAGANFSEQSFKNAELDGSYYFTQNITDNYNKTNRVNFLPQGDTNTISEGSTNNASDKHSANMEVEIKLDSTSRLNIQPSFSKTIGRNVSASSQKTYGKEASLLNESNNSSENQSNKLIAGSEIHLHKSAKKKGRIYGSRLKFNITEDDNLLNTKSTTLFHNSQDMSSDVRNQNRVDKSTSSLFSGEVRYFEPITDSLSVGMRLNYEWSKNDALLKTLNFDRTTGAYSQANDVLSNVINSTTQTLTPSLATELKKKKIRGGGNFGFDAYHYNNSALYLSKTTEVLRDYIFPNINLRTHITPKTGTNLFTRYSYRVSLPNATQIIPIENFTNPLNTIRGNESLRPTGTHNLVFAYQDYNPSSKNTQTFFVSGSYYKNQIVSSTVYDASNKAVTSYQNVDNVYEISSGYGGSKIFKKDNRTLKLSLNLNGGYTYSKGLTNNVVYQSGAVTLSPQAGVRYEIQELFYVEPSYSYNFYKTDYTNYIISTTENFTHTFKIESTNYWPKNFVFGNDFAYNYNSRIDGGFRKDFFLWNMSLGYNFFKNQFTAKVKVFDILDQNLSASRSITPTAIVDAQNTVLKRYVMFSLTFKLNTFGGASNAGSKRAFPGPRP